MNTPEGKQQTPQGVGSADLLATPITDRAEMQFRHIRLPKFVDGTYDTGVHFCFPSDMRAVERRMNRAEDMARRLREILRLEYDHRPDYDDASTEYDAMVANNRICETVHKQDTQ